MYDPTHNTNDYTSPMSAAQAAAAYDVESRFSMKDLLRIFWRRLWIVVMVVLIAVGTATGASLAQEPVYEASTKLLLGQDPSKDAAAANLMGSVEGLQQLTHTVATAVDSRPVAQEAIQRNGLQMDSQDLLNNLSVTQI